MTDELVPDEVEECQSCGYPTQNLQRVRRLQHQEWWMCAVCRNTFVGNATMYPEQYPDRNAMRTIAWGINAIIDAIVYGKQPSH